MRRPMLAVAVVAMLAATCAGGREARPAESPSPIVEEMFGVTVQ